MTEFALHFANLACPDPAQAHRLATAAESAGFSALLTVEHVVWPTHHDSVYPYSPTGKLPGGPETDLPDPLIWMTHVAAVTERLRFMTGVMVLPQRNPLVLAKQVASLDALSGGRIELGVGVGWLEEEFDAIGVPFACRGARTDDHIAAVRALWTADDASHHGPFVDFSGMSCNPKPVGGSVPIVVGGHSQIAAKRAGRLGDGFFPATGAAVDLEPLFETVRRSADEHGRDPEAIRRITGLPLPGPGSEALDDTDAIRRTCAELIDAGIDRLVVPTAPFLDDLEGRLAGFGRDVIAEFADPAR